MFVLTRLFTHRGFFCLYQWSRLYDAEVFGFFPHHWWMKVAVISLISDVYSLTQVYFL